MGSNGVIYEPAGRAREYCSLAVNLYRGCNHQCVYCYAPAATRISREEFKRPRPRKDVLSKLQKEVSKKKGDGAHVMLSFTSDPYNSGDTENRLTRQSIKILKSAGYVVVVLTKAGKLAERDFDILKSGEDYVGATLTFMDDGCSRQWEPHAALPKERFGMLREAKSKGLFTWVSLEPVIDPEQSLEIIRETKSYVDMYKIGKINYHTVAEPVDWRKFVSHAVSLLNECNKKYYIKQSLKKYLE